MKLRIEKDKLTDVVSRGGMSLKGDPMNDTSYIGYGHISVSAGRLTVLSSGPSVSSMASIDTGDLMAVDGSATLSVEDMIQILRYFPKNEEVLIEKYPSDSNPNGFVSMKSGKMKLNLRCINSRMFSQMDEPPPDLRFDMFDGEVVSKSLSRAASLPSTYDADGVYNNLALRRSGDLLYVGGGSDRMIGYLPVCPMDHDFRPVFIPTALIQPVVKFIVPGELHLASTGKKLFVKQNFACVRICLPDGIETKSRDYTRLIGKKMEAGFTVSKEKLADIVKGCMAVNKSEAMIRVRDGALSVESVSDGDGKNFMSVVEYGSPVPDVVPEYDFAIPPPLIMEFLKKCSSDVRMEFSHARIASNDRSPSFMLMKSDEFSTYMQPSPVILGKYGNHG